MAIDFGLYRTKLNVNGNTSRERVINTLKQNLDRVGANSASYKSVEINGVSCNLFIDSTNDEYVKTFCDTEGNITGAGIIIDWQNKKWLAESFDFDNEIYAKGKLRYCNYTLNFLDASGNAVSYPCCIQSPTGVGLNQEGQITVGKSQYTIKLPFDTNTALLDKTYPDGKTRRLLIDYSTNRPTAFEITHADRVTYPGLVELYINEVERSTDDNITLMIADYYSRAATTPVEPTDDGSCEITFNGEPIIEVGKAYKTFTAVFKDADGDVVETTPVWDIVLTDMTLVSKVITTSDDDYIKIKVTDRTMIGTPIRLELTNEDESLSTYVMLEVVSIG